MKILPSGAGLALLACLLFGLSTPFAKVLLADIPPIALAGLFYLGSGIGLTVWRFWKGRFLATPRHEAPLRLADIPWLAGAIVSGGLLAPLLLMLGLSSLTASSASLLLNLEGVFTALIAWFLFKEHFDRRIMVGMFAIASGGAVLSFSGGSAYDLTPGSLLIAAACLGWAVDNNLTRRVAAADPVQIAALKGLFAGAGNLAIALAFNQLNASLATAAAALVIGLFSYGFSLVLFVLALRHIGAARTGAYFSLAPFVGAAVAVPLLREQISLQFLVAAGLMALGLWLHLTERHEHEHIHEEMEHEHLHVHDEHHQHEHDPSDPPGEPHSHPHRHERLVHSHPHFPDIHHDHEH